MNKRLTCLSHFVLVPAIILGALPFLAIAQELPGGMTKEEFCEMLKNGQRPPTSQGARPPERSQPPTGGEFQEDSTRPDGMTAPEGISRPKGFTPSDIDCGNLESVPKTPTMQRTQPAVKSTTTSPRTPAPAFATSTREKSKLDQLTGENEQRSFYYGSETTFSNGASDDVKQNTGFFQIIVSKVTSIVKNVLGWFKW